MGRTALAYRRRGRGFAGKGISRGRGGGVTSDRAVPERPEVSRFEGSLLPSSSDDDEAFLGDEVTIDEILKQSLGTLRLRPPSQQG
jgi:hypothetical protein